MAVLFKMPSHSELAVNCLIAAVSTAITALLFRATVTNSNYLPINTRIVKIKAREQKMTEMINTNNLCKDSHFLA